MRSRTGYKAGFRGGRGLGFRGRGTLPGRGVDRYAPRFRGGFRGRGAKQYTSTRDESNYVNPNEPNNGYNHKPVRGGFKVFGRYRSKFDPVYHQSFKN